MNKDDELADLLTRLGNRAARWQVIAEDSFKEIQRLQLIIKGERV